MPDANAAPAPAMLCHANITIAQIYKRLDCQHLAKVDDAARPQANRKPS